ncbi:MAG: hypothetical protein JXR97_01550, partial [Planctomycetes bacterium]|nr:hypothetical protein [Planctomycetota bacterium]
AKDRILVSRKSFSPVLPDIEREIEHYKEWLKQRGRLDENQWTPEQLREHLLQVVSNRIQPIPFRAMRVFRFTGLPTDRDNLDAGLTIRYMFHGNRGGESAGLMQHGWIMVNPDTGASTEIHQASSKAGNTRELNVTGALVSDKGELELRIINLSDAVGEGEGRKPPATINVPLENGLEILVPVGSFEANFTRALILFWCRLAMIAAIGIAANTFISGPVAMFLVFGIIVSGTMNTFVHNIVVPKRTTFESPTKRKTHNQSQLEREWGTVIGGAIYHAEQTYNNGTAYVLEAMPNFDDTDPVNDLVVGREIPTVRLIWRFIADLGLRAGFFIFIGIFAFYRKEVGLPTSYS